jgi:hypothetical protein
VFFGNDLSKRSIDLHYLCIHLKFCSFHSICCFFFIVVVVVVVVAVAVVVAAAAAVAVAVAVAVLVAVFLLN